MILKLMDDEERRHTEVIAHGLDVVLRDGQSADAFPQQIRRDEEFCRKSSIASLPCGAGVRHGTKSMAIRSEVFAQTAAEGEFPAFVPHLAHQELCSLTTVHHNLEWQIGQAAIPYSPRCREVEQVADFIEATDN